MKVTAIIADELINNVKEYTHSATITEAITIVLNDWIDMYALKELNDAISKEPIVINSGNEIRERNRELR